jgi:hypothetical protein
MMLSFYFPYKKYFSADNAQQFISIAYLSEEPKIESQEVMIL